MQTYDILMLVVLAGATIFGAWKGLAWQVASLSAIFLSYFAALKFREPVAELMPAEAPWNVFLAMLAIYVATSAAIWLGFRLVANIIDRMKLKEFDRQIGALLGLAKGVLLCVIITLFAVTLSSEEQKRTICQSRSGYYIARLLDKADAVMPPEVHEVVHPYIHTLDAHIDHQAGGEPGLTVPSEWQAELPSEPVDRSVARMNETLDRVRKTAEALDQLRRE